MKILSTLCLMFLVSCNGGAGNSTTNASKEIEPESPVSYEGEIEELADIDYHTACLNGTNTSYKYLGNGELEVNYNRYLQNDCLTGFTDEYLLGDEDFHTIRYNCIQNESVLECTAQSEYFILMNGSFNVWDKVSCVDDHVDYQENQGAPNYVDGDCEVASDAQFVLSGDIENLVINGQSLTKI